MTAYYNRFLSHLGVPQEQSLHTDSSSLDSISGKSSLLIFFPIKSHSQSVPGSTATTERMLTLSTVALVLHALMDGWMRLAFPHERVKAW